MVDYASIMVLLRSKNYASIMGIYVGWKSIRGGDFWAIEVRMRNE